MAPDWILSEVYERPGHYYRYHVRGVNLNTLAFFAWSIPSIATNAHRYDVNGARYEVDAENALGFRIFKPFDFLDEASRFHRELCSRPGMRWVRLQVADVRVQERFAPVVLNEWGTPK